MSYRRPPMPITLPPTTPDPAKRKGTSDPHQASNQARVVKRIGPDLQKRLPHVKRLG